MPNFLVPGTGELQVANTRPIAAVDPIGAYAPIAGKPLRQCMGIVLLAMCGLLAACRHELPEQALRATIAGMQAAVQAHDVGAVLEPVTEDFAGPEGMGRQQLRRYVTVVTLQNQKLAVQLGPLDLKLFGDRATVSFTAATTGGAGWLPDRAQVYQVETGWRLEGDDWKLMTASWEPRL